MSTGELIFTFHYVSINTDRPARWFYTANDFTFHYVSINTTGAITHPQ